jgi:Fe-S-cluster containining protein
MGCGVHTKTSLRAGHISWHPLQGHIEVMTSSSPSLGQCVLLNKDTTVKKAYFTDSLPCHTRPLQGHVEVLTSPGASLGWCVLLNKDTTANQVYLMGSLLCCTHPLQNHVLTSPSPSLGRCVN